MRDSAGFDLWADGYDQSVGRSDEADCYPFAGYKKLLNEIFNRVLSRGYAEVLDLGFGTAALTARLYERGLTVWGQDFSRQMLESAQAKMPGAKLFLKDFSQGLAEELKGRRFDAVISTYALHHLSDPGKVGLLRELLGLLNPGGSILIGDVAFATRAELEACKASSPDWDEAEFYFVYEEFAPHFPNSTFTPMSSCAGLIELRP